MAERYVIGVDIGGSKLLAGAFDTDLAVSHRTNRPVLGLTQDELLDRIEDAVTQIRGAVEGGVAAVGFGLPCTFDLRTGVAVQAVHLPVHDLAFATVMEERLGLPVFADNDGNCSVLAEVRAGAARGVPDAVMISLGTGIASGIVVDGRVYRGATGAGAEIGHMVVDYDGPPCHGNCPNRGCLEVMASGTALVRYASLAVARRPSTALGRALEDGSELTGPLVSALAGDGDPVALDALGAIGRALGVGLANVVNIFNPSVIVVGGGVIGAGELLLAPAREEMLARALPPGRDQVEVVAAAFGADAGMVGAAVLAREGLAARSAAPSSSSPASPSPTSPSPTSPTRAVAPGAASSPPASSAGNPFIGTA